MPIDVVCPGCHHLYRVGDHMAGKKVRCKECSAAITVPSTSAPAEEDEGLLSNLSALGAPPPSPSESAPASGPMRFKDENEPEWTSSVNVWDLSASMAEIKHRV